MIIVEGTDKAGKTTLIDTLLRYYPRGRKFGVPDGDPIPGYVAELRRDDVGECVYDRLFHGEWVYSAVKARHKYMSRFDLAMLELMVNTHPHLVIFVRPKAEVLSARHDAERDTYVTFGEALQAQHLYEDVFAESHCSNVVMYDGVSPTDSLRALVVKAHSEDEFRDYSMFMEFPYRGIGTRNPSVLFVADELNPRARFQVPLWCPSGEYLFKALSCAATVDWGDCHIVNSKEGDHTISADYINSLRPGFVIALGDKAWSRIVDLNLDMEAFKVNHPAYMKRFSYEGAVEYGLEIEELCSP